MAVFGCHEHLSTVVCSLAASSRRYRYCSVGKRSRPRSDLIYTGIMRSKRLLVLIGQKKARPHCIYLNETICITQGPLERKLAVAL